MDKRILSLLLFAALTLPATAQRLPRVAIPISYEITFTPDLEAERFAGRETIDVLIQVPTRQIELNAAEITFQSVRAVSGESEMEAVVRTDESRETATFEFPQQLPVGPATLEIEFSGIHNRQLRGFYIGESDGRKYASTQMQAADARRAFPCFDEPELKATFAIRMVLDERDRGISNGALVSDTPGPAPGKHTLVFSTTPRISSYLVALVVGDLDCLSDEVDGIPLRICGLGGRSRLGRYALDATKAILRHYDSYFTIAYPFGKLDQIGVPDFRAGAMENAGAIIYRETALLADESTASPSTLRSIARIISHEIAHQWFGDLVTMKWWDDIWLNEGFASWATPKGVANWKPEWPLRVGEAAAAGRPLEVDSLNSTRPIRNRAETPEEIEAAFDGIAYGKTAAVLRMVESYAGEERFRDGVNLYIGRNAFGNASAGEFIAAMGETAGSGTAAVLQSYVDQPGVPVVTVSSVCEAGESIITLSQERFFGDRSVSASVPQSWVIPVCPAGGECLLLRERQQTFRLPGCDPRFFNADGRGYYVTQYEPEALGRLRDRFDSLSPSERLVLQRDEWHLMRAGRRPVSDFLDLAAAARNEREGTVLTELLDQLGTIDRRLVSDQQRPLFRAWLRELLAPMAKDLGWSPLPGESEERRSARTAVLELLAEAGDAATIRKARELAARELSKPYAVDPSIVSTVLEIAARNGDRKTYDAFLSAYRRAPEPERKARFLQLLARFRDPALLQRTLELSLTDTVRAQDTGRLIGGVLRNTEGAEPGKRFLVGHWDAIAAKLSSRAAASLPAALSSSCSTADIAFLDDLVSRHGLRGGERALAQARERIASCAALRAFQNESLGQWLAAHPSSAAGRDALH